MPIVSESIPIDIPADRSAFGGAALTGRRQVTAVVAISLGTAMTTISGSILNVALPTLSQDLRVAPSAAVTAVTIYQLVLLMALLPLSALGDRIGQRRMYQLGQLVFVLTSLLAFFVRDLPLLLVMRAISAVGAAAVLSVSSSLIRNIYPASRLGRGLSFNTVIAASAAMLAPTVGGLILSVAPWPWLFAAMVPFGLLSLLIGQAALPAPPARRESFDMRAAIMCAAMFGFVVVGLEGTLHGMPLAIAATSIVAGVALGTVFVRRELRVARPVLPVDLLRRAETALGAAGLLAAFLASIVIMITLPFRLQQQYHFQPAEVGAILGVWPIVTLFAAPTSGALSDRVPAALLGAIAMVIATAATITFAFVPAAPSHFDLVWRLGLCSLGYSMFFAPNMRQIIASAPVDRSAAAGGLTNTIRGAGQTLGATTAAAILASGVGTGPIPPLIAAALAAFSGLCCLVVLRRGQG